MNGTTDRSPGNPAAESSARDVCRRFRVTGRVQGVFFRDSTRRTATELGLTGYAKNQADGSVEVLACGSEDALDRLVDWLQSGPKLASVERVEAEPADVGRKPDRFTIG
ncbi:MAG TPA: acylphosphatase [Woeseiaceae bacterium]|nr:acylphosphatase [Woeseiaceae bacterium]